MKTKLVGLMAIALLALTGCTQSDEARAKKLCEEEIHATVEGDKVEIVTLNPGSLSDLGFADGVTNQRDHSENILLVTGDIRAWEGSVETKLTAMCTVTLRDGQAPEVDLMVV